MNLEKTLKTMGIVSSSSFGVAGTFLGMEHLIPDQTPDLIEYGLAGFTGLIGGLAMREISSSLLWGKKKYPNSSAGAGALYSALYTPIDERNLTTEESLKNISDSLTQIRTSYEDGTSILGTGLLLTDNHLLTARHVVEGLFSGKKEEIPKIEFSNKEQKGLIYRNLAYGDKNSDLALLKLSSSIYARPKRFKLNLTPDISPGNEVRVSGFRDGQHYSSLGSITDSRSEFSINGTEVNGLFETDVKGLPGQSGGVIINREGEVIGVNVYSRTRRGDEIGNIGGVRLSALEGLAYAMMLEETNGFFY